MSAPTLTREEFSALVDEHGENAVWDARPLTDHELDSTHDYASDTPAAAASHDALLGAFDALTEERDAALAALRARGEIRLDIRGGSELRLRVGTLLQLHWKTLTNPQFDAIKAICDEAGEQGSREARGEAVKLLPVALLALCLTGCVTVQPCVCPTPASPAPTPDVLIPEHEARTLEPWFDGCNWHTPLGNGLEDVTAAWCGPAGRPR